MLQAGVQILRVFPKNDHVDGNALEPGLEPGQHAHGAEIYVEVEPFAERDVDALVTACYRDGGRSFQAYARALESVEKRMRQQSCGLFELFGVGLYTLLF